VTLLLAHPEAENLGRFVEGTLDDPERAAIVQHIADCDDCRILVVDAAELIEPAKVESHRWWMGIAASVMLVAAIGTVTYHQYHDPLAKVKEDYARVSNRPSKARLSGFPYVLRQDFRGGPNELDVSLELMKSDAADAAELKGNSAKTLHARGIGLLLSEDDPKASIAPLQSAAERDPSNAKYQSDLAAALFAAAGGNPAMLQSALAAADRALRIDPRSPDALFNRAVVLQDLNRPEALAAYDRYLAVDSVSPWAAEARSHRDLLRPLP
jgi:tetratricopeptide (TPR) repeat protein